MRSLTFYLSASTALSLLSAPLIFARHPVSHLEPRPLTGQTQVVKHELKEGMLLRRAPVRSHSCRGRKRHDKREGPGHDDEHGHGHGHGCDPHTRRNHKETDHKHLHEGDKTKSRNDHHHHHHHHPNRGHDASSTSSSSQHPDTHTHKKHGHKSDDRQGSVSDPKTGSGEKGHKKQVHKSPDLRGSVSDPKTGSREKGKPAGTDDPQGKQSQPVQPTTPTPGGGGSGTGDPPKGTDPSKKDGSPKTKEDTPPTTPKLTPGLGTGGKITTYTGQRRGNITFYAVDDDGRGACLLPVRKDRMFAAINNDGWAGSAQCGMCVRVETLDGSRSTTVMITNQEPVDDNGALDLSEAAFTALADRRVGRFVGHWTAVDCHQAGLVSGIPSVVWKNGSSKDWFALQVRGSALPLAKVSIRVTASTPSSWISLERTNYNFWAAEHGVPDSKGGKSEGPFDLFVEYQDGSHIILPAVKLNSEVLKQV